MQQVWVWPGGQSLWRAWSHGGDAGIGRVGKALRFWLGLQGHFVENHGRKLCRSTVSLARSCQINAEAHPSFIQSISRPTGIYWVLAVCRLFWYIRDSDEGASWNGDMWQDLQRTGGSSGLEPRTWPGGGSSQREVSSFRERGWKRGAGGDTEPDGAQTGRVCGAQELRSLPASLNPGRWSHGHWAFPSAGCGFPSLWWILACDAPPRAPGARALLCTQPFSSSLTQNPVREQRRARLWAAHVSLGE